MKAVGSHVQLRCDVWSIENGRQRWAILEYPWSSVNLREKLLATLDSVRVRLCVRACAFVRVCAHVRARARTSRARACACACTCVSHHWP